MKALLDRLEDLDRRWIYLIVGVGALLPLIYPLNLPVTITPPVRNIYDYIEKLGPEDAVIVSFDYGPSTGPENDPMAEAVMRHILARGIKLVVIALYPLGGVTMSQLSLDRVAKEFPELTYGKDYVNLGYKSGGIAVLKAMGQDLHTIFPMDLAKRPIADLPMMQKIKSYKDLKLAVSIATGIIGEWWANLVNAQYGLPVAVGCTAVSAPKYYAYLRSGNMLGLMGGLKAASEYEKLVMDGYPALRRIYERLNGPGAGGGYTAIKGMDVQSVVHLIIIAFIVLGNLAYFRSRKRPHHSEE